MVASSCSRPNTDKDRQHARTIDGNARTIDGNARTIDGNARTIDGNARTIDGNTRQLGINDILPNPSIGRTSSALAFANTYGAYLPEDADSFVESYPSTFTGPDRCLDLDAGAVATTSWRVRATQVDDARITSGVIEIDRGAGWEPPAFDEILYLPAAAARNIEIPIGATHRPLLLKARLVGEVPVRNPVDLAAPAGGDGALGFFKPLYVVAFCLPDPVDAPTAAWIEVGPVSLSDSTFYDLVGGVHKAKPGSFDASGDLLPYLKFTSYHGVDPIGTGAKAEAYYTGGLVARDQGSTHHFWLDCPSRGEYDRVHVPPSRIAALIAAVFANIITLPLDAGDPGAVLGMTLAGTDIRVSLLPPPGCTVRVPQVIEEALQAAGLSTKVDWLPSPDELSNPGSIDTVATSRLLQGVRVGELARGPNTEACGSSRVRESAWAEALGWTDLSPYLDQRAARCSDVRISSFVTAGEHIGPVAGWTDNLGLQRLDDRLTAVASALVDRRGCGDQICDAEFREESSCPSDCPALDMRMDPDPLPEQDAGVEEPDLAPVEDDPDAGVEEPDLAPVEDDPDAGVEEPDLAPVEDDPDAGVEEPDLAPVEDDPDAGVEEPDLAPVEDDPDAGVEDAGA
jgi:hypothetical protein